MMKKRMAKAGVTNKRPKAIAYVLIPRESEFGAALYRRLATLTDQHHDELNRAGARIVLAWCVSWKPDVDGRLTLGKCKKATDLDRELSPFDFVILLNRDFWQDPRVTDHQRAALLDHELCHAGISYDESGEPKVDERGRTVFRVVKHDLEEFADIATRYGCYKRDLEDFAMALDRGRRKSSGSRVWVGISSLVAKLAAVGAPVPLETVAEWDDAERREAETWAATRQELKDQGAKSGTVFEIPVPKCVEAALPPGALDEPPAPSAAVSH